MSAIAEIQEKLAGVWVLKTNENLDAYLQEIGVGFIMRKLAVVANSTMTIAIEGEKIRISTNRPKDSQAFFTLGEEFDCKDPQDNQFKAIATWQNGVLFTDAKPVDPYLGIPHLIERRIVDGDLEMKITVNNVVCKRIFKKKSD
ncbi:hypothetical protein CHS0354_018140 [Potamilus streckersoni]|uniref:Lipocalin/cytosolic fatty-acid binding domain-containing protein n=1 Tax=Potamilus streckersoni TaxID=2493646 RepID=A0AAE0W213_9BIVA|nr:hypothetical protein CHS0354_018140 [Potamilus streckersoni]